MQRFHTVSRAVYCLILPWVLNIWLLSTLSHKWVHLFPKLPLYSLKKQITISYLSFKFNFKVFLDDQVILISLTNFLNSSKLNNVILYLGSVQILVLCGTEIGMMFLCQQEFSSIFIYSLLIFSRGGFLALWRIWLKFQVLNLND